MKIKTNATAEKNLSFFFLSSPASHHSQYHRRAFNIYIYFDMSTHARGGRRIRTSDLHFMRRGPHPIELPIWDMTYILILIPEIS